MLYFETVSIIMYDVSTRSTPKNIREPFIHLSDFHAYNTVSRVQILFFLYGNSNNNSSKRCPVVVVPPAC